MSNMNGLNAGKYVPSSTIRTEPLTSKYTILGDIGRGKFAVVRKCVNRETGETVAAKVIRKRRKGKSCREEILREVVMLEYAMAHPRLVRLCEVYETQSELILVTEYCAGGELFHECVIEESFKEKDVVHLMVQILEGLIFLHENNIVHLDLKPQNILLTEPFPKGDIKICDLGFACLTNTGEDIRDIIGTPDYVAPEVLDYEPLSIQADMWSLGVLAYVMLTACSPFAGDTQQETFCNISQVKLDFPDDLFSDISEDAKNFICKLLVKDPRGRMTARQCLEHPWLKAVSAQMHISLPPQDHTADLAKSMALPSNWNPDRRSSFSKTLASPALSALGAKSQAAAQPAGCQNSQPDLTATQHGVTADQKDDGSNAGHVASLSERQSEDTLSRTSEDVGIDTSRFTSHYTDNRDIKESLSANLEAESLTANLEAARKRQSMEIPVKKAKCCDSDADEDMLFVGQTGKDGVEHLVLNGAECSMEQGEPTAMDEGISASPMQASGMAPVGESNLVSVDKCENVCIRL